jgi:hypothetical protein
VKPAAPLFLARRGYRYRRLTDAARILPVLGAFLFLLPLLWGGGMTRSGVIYLFSVWLGLIILSAILARLLSAHGERAQEDGEGGAN